MNDKVSRLRQLMAESVPRPLEPTAAQAAAQREYEYFAANEPVQRTLDMSPRARAIRDIMRIATWYRAESALTLTLDKLKAASLGDLPDDALTQLLEDMRQIELCVQTGAGSPFAPPAN